MNEPIGRVIHALVEIRNEHAREAKIVRRLSWALGNVPPVHIVREVKHMLTDLDV